MIISIKGRFIGVAIVLSLGGIVVAGDERRLTPEEYCNQNFKDTSLVMSLRQENINSKREEVKQISASTLRGKKEVLEAIVDKAFSVPYQYNYSNKEKVINEFKEVGYNTCLSIKEKEIH
jgi:RPA family protein